jgi:hypothetical protein
MRMLYKWSCQSPNGFWQNEEVCKRNVPFPHYLVLTERQSLTYLKSNSQHQVVVVHFSGFILFLELIAVCTERLCPHLEYIDPCPSIRDESVEDPPKCWPQRFDDDDELTATLP